MSPAGTIVPPDIRELYEIYEWRHAAAVLASDFPDEWDDILSVLRGFRLYRSEILIGGGGLTKGSKKLAQAFIDQGWTKNRKFETEVYVDEKRLESRTHKLDCFKNRVGVEIEWNNKDPFFDRDLNSFRLLFDLQAVSAGVIITRCDELQELFNALGIGAKYGPTTTQMKKLLPRLNGGAGGGCPILVFGITRGLYDAER